jgi:hypothetical protein
VTDLGWIGVWLLVVCAAAIALEGALFGLWVWRITKRGRLLSERLAAEQRLVDRDVARLKAALAETEALWQPYARLLHLLRHPVVAALITSFVRRRATAR